MYEWKYIAYALNVPTVYVTDNIEHGMCTTHNLFHSEGE